MRAPTSLLAMCVLILTYCSHVHDHANDHNHDDVKLFLWGYSESFEVFAEADPFSTGSNSVILVHITRLNNFSALESGKVTASLILGNRGIRQTLSEPERPGMFMFILQPELSGEAQMIIDIDADGIEEQVHLGQLTVFNDAHDAIHDAEDRFPDIPGAVVFTKMQAWSVDFATANARKERFGPVYRTVGEAMSDRSDEVIINARTTGIVRFTGNNLYPGMTVNANQFLLNIYGGELSEGNAALRYQEAKNNYSKAKADYERIVSLRQEMIVSERELLEAMNVYENAAAIYNNLRQHFSESGQTVSSPWGGYIKDVMVREGEYVSPGQAIMTIARNRNLIIRAEVQQHFADNLSSIAQVHVGWSGQPPLTLAELKGRVISVGRSIDPATGMIPVHIQVTGQAASFFPGSLVNVYIKTVSDGEVVTVPNTALIEEQGSFFVFVQNHPESFSKRQVHIGQSDGLMTHILSGLKEDERLVTKGAVMVKLAAATGDLDPHSGHVH